ncbi:MAG: hypothetical protein Q9169_005527 [Polycauliona sp. 2 TL-2023]
MDKLVFFDSPPRGWEDDYRYDYESSDQGEDYADVDTEFWIGFTPWKCPSRFICFNDADLVCKACKDQSTTGYGKGDRRDKKRSFEILIGSERDRRSFCVACPISFLGLYPRRQSLGEFVDFNYNKNILSPYVVWDSLRYKYQDKTIWSISIP